MGCTLQDRYLRAPDKPLSEVCGALELCAPRTSRQIDIYGWGQWVFDALARAFHPTIDGHNGIKDVILSVYTATPPSTNCDGCVALQSVSALLPASVKRDVPAGAEVPEVTEVPEVKRIALPDAAASEITHMPKAFRA